MIDLSSKKASQIFSPPIIVLYGGPGIGKTAFGVGSDASSEYLVGKSNHILMNVDFRGGDRLTCHRLFNTPVEGMKGLMEGFKALAEQKHEFSWLCIDDLSTLEELFVAEVCKECKVTEIGKVEYGKGYELAKTKWFQFFDCVKGLQEEKNIGVILLAHSKVEASKDPTTGETFNRFDLQMDKRSKDIIKKSVDLIGFAHKKTLTRSVDAGFGRKENVAIGDARRIVSFAPDVESFESKDRFNMPKEIDLDFSIFETEISKFFQTMQTTKTNKKGDK
jgi:hypothetical protein